MKNFYDFDKDPTIPSVTDLWNLGYNVNDDVFRSTILSHIVKCNHNLHEREFGGNLYDYPIDCGDCGTRTIFTTSGKKVKNIKSILCEDCKKKYRYKKKNEGYMRYMTNKLIKINDFITDSIIKKIDKDGLDL
jgi:hypothetical protein